MFRKIAPNARFERSLKAFHDTGFGFDIAGGEEKPVSIPGWSILCLDPIVYRRDDVRF
jgi:hypothetical protein